MIRKIFVGFAMLLCSLSFAQNGSTSPYSFFGLGENRNRGTIENQTLGGLSLYADSVAISLRNPAAFGRLLTTTYTVAATSNNTNFVDANETESISTGAFEYLALGFPLGKRFGVGLGVLPLTSVGFQLQSVIGVDDQIESVEQIIGEGGLNRVFVSLGYGITKNFSVGATLNYDFGSIDNEILTVITDVEFASRQISESSFIGFDVNLALNYQGKITKNLSLYSSVLFTPESSIRSTNSRRLEVVSLFTAIPVVVQSEDVDLGALNLDEIDIVSPQAATFGLGIGRQNKWFVGAEYEMKQFSNFDNPFLGISNVQYEDATRFSIGGFYIPKFNSLTKYLSRVTYRAGLRYEETGLIVNNVPVNDFGISFGLGLPVGGSKLNIGFEAGRRGTTTAGRFEDNYFNINLGLSLSGIWFRKVKFN